MSTFKKEFDSLADAILTNAIVMEASKIKDGQSLPPFVYTDNAAWDTGAQFTFISPRLVETLHLQPYKRGQIMGIGGDQTVNIYLVHIGLPNGQMIYKSEVYCSDIDDYDLLIGMDIIGLTDFLITNSNNHTTFQFRIPSTGNISL